MIEQSEGNNHTIQINIFLNKHDIQYSRKVLEQDKKVVFLSLSYHLLKNYSHIRGGFVRSM